jgi:hypothetical protein
MQPGSSCLGRLLAEQAGVVTHAQLRAVGVTDAQRRAQIAASRWRSVNATVVVTHNGPLTVGQQQWAVVLSANGLVALCGLTTLQNFGVRGFETDVVHVLVEPGGRVRAVPLVAVAAHQSRRFGAVDVLPRLPPTVGIERATIDAAAWSPDIKTATRVIVAPIQQRFTSASRLSATLTAAGSVNFSGVLVPFVADLEGGAEALSEVAFLRWCRRHGFPRPELQVRHDGQGRRRYLDAIFELSSGGRLWVEIDGGIHLTLTTRWQDTIKDNDAVIARRPALRFPSVAIYSDDPIAVEQLAAGLKL